jgi:hypothetical protein
VKRLINTYRYSEISCPNFQSSAAAKSRQEKQPDVENSAAWDISGDVYGNPLVGGAMLRTWTLGDNFAKGWNTTPRCTGTVRHLLEHLQVYLLLSCIDLVSAQLVPCMVAPLHNPIVPLRRAVVRFKTRQYRPRCTPPSDYRRSYICIARPFDARKVELSPGASRHDPTPTTHVSYGNTTSNDISLHGSVRNSTITFSWSPHLLCHIRFHAP